MNENENENETEELNRAWHQGFAAALEIVGGKDHASHAADLRQRYGYSSTEPAGQRVAEQTKLWR